jgi:hypothetical protein
MDMKEIVVHAMYESIDKDAREKLIKEALATLLAPSEGKFGRMGPSALERAFQDEVGRVASAMVRDDLQNNPENREKVRAAVAAAFDKFFAGTELSDRMASAMWKIVGE